MGGYGPPKTPKKCGRCGELFMRKSGNGLYCPACRKVKLREWENESHARNRDHYRAKNRGAATKLRNKQKLMVINRYSGGMNACICCGEREPRFLALDHINNNGSEERRRLTSWLGSAFYYWLVKHNFPPGYQVLCHNCNSSKAKHGVCIHNVSKTMPAVD
jgi:uncharacterized Zn finger protein (UPF0148 family)